MQVSFQVNGEAQSVDVEPDTPLLWILREHLGLIGTKYGCGVAMCGACMVHVDGQRAFACQTPASVLEGRSVATVEGLSDGEDDHPILRAWIEEQVPQCGYCQPGMIMSALDLLQSNPAPTREEIVTHMNTNLCRCGTYPRVVKAIERAAEEMQA